LPAPTDYKKYADQVPAILAEYGGKPLAGGGRSQIMEGPKKFERFVVIEFPSFERAVAFTTMRRASADNGRSTITVWTLPRTRTTKQRPSAAKARALLRNHDGFAVVARLVSDALPLGVLHDRAVHSSSR
jgi:hypothetical protein